jgi:hypothetical protein
MAMDPTIKALAKIKREIRKIVLSAPTLEERLTVLDFAEREATALRKELVVSDRNGEGQVGPV